MAPDGARDFRFRLAVSGSATTSLPLLCIRHVLAVIGVCKVGPALILTPLAMILSGLATILPLLGAVGAQITPIG